MRRFNLSEWALANRSLVLFLMIVVGLVGTVLPALPGLPLVFAGMLVAAWADGFTNVPAWVLVLLGLLTLVTKTLLETLTAHRMEAHA